MPCGIYNRVMESRGWECEIGAVLEVTFELKAGDVKSRPGKNWRWGDVTDGGSKVQGLERSKPVMFKEQKFGKAKASIRSCRAP